MGCGSSSSDAVGGPDAGTAGAPSNDAGAGPDADAGDSSAPLAACRLPAPMPPACGSGTFSWESVIASPTAGSFDAALADKADRFDRQFHGLNAFATGLNAGMTIPEGNTADRMLVDQFIAQNAEWDFEAFSSRPVAQVGTAFDKATGAFAGAGIAADAYRYATLREQGAACADVDRARAHLVRDLDALHLATAITGVEGVIARAFARKDLPGQGEVPTTPLFDSNGAALPTEKDNGTWREDNSGGLFPDHVWEDSASRDQLVGWVLGFAAAWEVIRDDPTFDDASKSRLQADAVAIAKSLMIVGDEGFDLEIRDADGRRTFHGILHEDSLDRIYLPGAENGFNAIIAVGILGAIDYIAADPEVARYFEEVIIEQRQLHVLSRDKMNFVDLGVMSNYSAYHMAFQGGLLATRYICDDAIRDVMRDAVRTGLYDRGGDRQPTEQKQSFYDLVFATADAGITAWSSAATPPDAATVARGVESLEEFPAPPYFGEDRINCDDAEIAADDCVGIDGTPITLLASPGRGGTLVSRDPMPMRIRPTSNWFWRSNPYQVNAAGNPSGLNPAADFRVVYWLGRWARATP